MSYIIATKSLTVEPIGSDDGDESEGGNFNVIQNPILIKKFQCCQDRP